MICVFLCFVDIESRVFTMKKTNNIDFLWVNDFLNDAQWKIMSDFPWKCDTYYVYVCVCVCMYERLWHNFWLFIYFVTWQLFEPNFCVFIQFSFEWIFIKNFHFVGQRASISSLPANVTVKEGKRIRLVCRVKGQPPPKVTWFKDDRSLSRLRKTGGVRGRREGIKLEQFK